MDGTSARGQKVSDLTALLADLSLASNRNEFRAKLVRRIAMQLSYSEPIILFVSHESDSPKIVDVAEGASAASSVKLQLEERSELLRKLAAGDFIGISYSESSDGADRRNVILVPIMAGTLEGVLGLALRTDVLALPDDDLEELRQIAHYAAPLLARIREIESLRARLVELEAARVQLDALEKRVGILRDENQNLACIAEMQAHLHANVAHELRTPLATIRGYTRMILDGRTGDLSPTQHNYLTIVAENTNRLIQLVNWTSHISQVGGQPLQLGSADLAEIWLESRPAQLAAIAEKGLEFTESIPEGEFPLICDARKIAQVFGALLSIAIEHVNPEGRLSIEFIRGREGETSVRISDNGRGLPPEMLAVSGERSTRPGLAVVQPEKAVTNLGDVHDVIGLHGGRLFVTTKAGEGTTFLFSLPAVLRESEEKSHDEQAVHSGRRRR